MNTKYHTTLSQTSCHSASITKENKCFTKKKTLTQISESSKQTDGAIPLQTGTQRSPIVLELVVSRTWMEVIRIDLKKCNLSKDLAQDRLEWRNKIHVADPNIVGTTI